MKRLRSYPVELREKSYDNKPARTQYRANMAGTKWYNILRLFNTWTDVLMVDDSWKEEEVVPDELWYAYGSIDDILAENILANKWSVHKFERYIEDINLDMEYEWYQKVIKNV